MICKFPVCIDDKQFHLNKENKMLTINEAINNADTGFL